MCMFGWGGPPYQLRPKKHHIGGVELSHHFFAKVAHILSHQLQPMSSEYSIDGRHIGKTPRENPALECHGPNHDPLVVGHLGTNVYLILTLNKPSFGLIKNWSGDDSLRFLSRINTITIIRRGRLD